MTTTVRSPQPLRPGRWLPGLCLGLLLAVSSSCSSEETAKVHENASQAPQIPVPDATNFALADHAGKIVIVNFWATWCPPCRVEIPALVKLRQEFTDEDLIIVGISTGEYGSPEQIADKLESFIDRNAINYPIYYDQSQQVTKRFNKIAPFINIGIPATLIFDRQGHLATRHLGVPRTQNGRLDPFGVIQQDIQELIDKS